MPKVKKTSSVIHPNSRKASQLARKLSHNEKLEKRKEELNLKQKLKVTKLKWFQENLDLTKDVYAAAEVKELVERYLERFQKTENTEETKLLKRHISSSTFQDYKTKFLVDMEKSEYESSGLEIPDLMQKKNYDTFKAWNGDAQLLSAIEIVRLSKKQLEKSLSNEKGN